MLKIQNLDRIEIITQTNTNINWEIVDTEELDDKYSFSISIKYGSVLLFLEKECNKEKEYKLYFYDDMVGYHETYLNKTHIYNINELINNIDNFISKYFDTSNPWIVTSTTNAYVTTAITNSYSASLVVDGIDVAKSILEIQDIVKDLQDEINKLKGI